MSPLNPLRTYGAALTLTAVLAGCQAESEKPAPAARIEPATAAPAPSPAPSLAEPTRVGEPIKRVSGMVYETLKEGAGPQVKSGDTVTVHCIASIKDDKPFFSTRESSHPVTFKLGDSRLIQGWNEGIAGMKIGELRKVTVPPNMGYGALGRLPAIPPNGTLRLEIEALALGEPPAELKAEELGRRFAVPSMDQMKDGKNEWMAAPAKEPEKATAAKAAGKG